MLAKKVIEECGYEVVVFHPNGTGGRAMEELVDRGLFQGVLDFTPHEITDELFGGFHAAGPHRLEAAGRRGLPQVVVPGCVDFLIRETQRELGGKYRRLKYHFTRAEPRAGNDVRDGPGRRGDGEEAERGTGTDRRPHPAARVLDVRRAGAPAPRPEGRSLIHR
jgi:hypothetical protein